ncbi:hypothetical protein [Ruminococcus sp. Marseille-P6503]|uniref:metal-dependent transcriptional regulator n=1 Tax=Ruminococcus sp. Marseille-P6503 TaxID=2364796 RepID=UPI000F51F473|nr:hypothetical protein [Ruminococcus sp. Marseille-P6503]
MTDALKRYLLAIYELSDGGKPVKSAEVSKKLSVTKSSTAKMTAKLELHGLISKPYYSEITLTPTGIACAGKLYTNKVIIHEFLSRFMKIAEPDAENDAVTCICSLSDKTVERLARLTIKNVEKRTRK